MKKTNKAKIALCLSVLSLALLLCACQGETPSDSMETETTAAPSAEKALISADTGSDYVVVREDIDGKPHELDVALALLDAIEEECGVRLTLKTDWYRDTHGFPPQAREILVGDTNREESALVKEEMGAENVLDWTVRLVGEKLVLYGGSDGALDHALSYLLENHLQDGVLRVPEDLCMTYRATESENRLAMVELAVDTRAKEGRTVHLTEQRRWDSARGGDLRNLDIHGITSAAVLMMPESELQSSDIATANRILRKCAGYMTTDIPSGYEKNTDGECDFVASRLVRVLYADPDRIEPETAERVKQFFLEDDFCSRHYSENHMLLFRIARYLAAAHYAEETFTQYGKTGAELWELDRAYLIDFLQYRARRGWAEFDSLVYGVEVFMALLNLYDCAPDEELRTLAQMTMDTILLSMIVDSTENGIYGGAHGRNYDVSVTDMHYGFFYIYALYFGETSLTDTETKMPYSKASFVYTSDYRPDKSLYDIVAAKSYPFTNREQTHNHTLDFTPVEYGFINKYTYNTALYSIGCVTQQDSMPPSAWYEEHQQTNWSLVFAENAKATITTHHPGTDTLHAYWYGDLGCGCNHLFGDENSVIGIYYIPGAKDLNFIHAYVPRAQFDEVIEQPEQNRIFVRLGDVYAALQFSHSYAWSSQAKGSEIVVYDGDKVKNLRIAMACEAGDRESYGSFESFIEAVEKKEFRFDADSLTLDYGELRLTLETQGKTVIENAYINGVRQSFPYGKTYDSPYMQSVFDSGVIEVITPEYTRVMDFMRITDTVKE